jgi:hypothetical protein
VSPPFETKFEGVIPPKELLVILFFRSKLSCMRKSNSSISSVRYERGLWAKLPPPIGLLLITDPNLPRAEGPLGNDSDIGLSSLPGAKLGLPKSGRLRKPNPKLPGPPPCMYGEAEALPYSFPKPLTPNF